MCLLIAGSATCFNIFGALFPFKCQYSRTMLPGGSGRGRPWSSSGVERRDEDSATLSAFQNSILGDLEPP